MNAGCAAPRPTPESPGSRSDIEEYELLRLRAGQYDSQSMQSILERQACNTDRAKWCHAQCRNDMNGDGVRLEDLAEALEPGASPWYASTARMPAASVRYALLEMRAAAPCRANACAGSWRVHRACRTCSQCCLAEHVGAHCCAKPE